ncbi:MAG: hypothetical protein K0B05_11005 [Bacteroidales bacterium]|nr:hypothetical protein [Bacteroidales bacterium]
MDSLIAMRATGSPEAFAHKMKISRSTLFETIQEIKLLGVDIKYSNIEETYYYADERRLIIGIQKLSRQT